MLVHPTKMMCTIHARTPYQDDVHDRRLRLGQVYLVDCLWCGCVLCVVHVCVCVYSICERVLVCVCTAPVNLLCYSYAHMHLVVQVYVNKALWVKSPTTPQSTLALGM